MADFSFHLNGKEDDTHNPKDLLELKQKLDSELHLLEVAKQSDDQGADETNSEDLKARISELNEELVEESTKVSWRNLLIKRIEFGRLSDNILQQKDKSFVDTCLKELELASEILRIHQEITDLEKSYTSEKLINTELKNDNAALIQRLKDNKVKAKSVSSEVKKNPEYKKLKAELDIKDMSVDINKSLITQLVFGAGLDWDSDPHLRSIVLEDKIDNTS